MTLQRKIYTVTKLNSDIKELLEEKFPIIWITGEISNFHVPISGHYYFTLKDDQNKINCLMFSGQNRNLKFLPEKGMSITGLCRVTVYPPNGVYQVLFEHLEPKGVGELQIAFQQLKESLSKQGIFDKEHKKQISVLTFPKKISLITSSTGSVVHDFIRVANKRFVNIYIQIIPVKVQGEDSVSEIVSALDFVNRQNDSDIIVLARGGGSFEDLYPFNSEAVVMAIFYSNIFVISAIGHETDYTLSDLAADLRAPTPSVAAIYAMPDKKELLKRVHELSKNLKSSIMETLSLKKIHLNQLKKRVINPLKRVDDFRFKIDDLSKRLTKSILRVLIEAEARLVLQKKRICFFSPLTMITNYKLRLNNKNSLLLSAALFIVNKNRAKIAELNATLYALNPALILKRGYSIAKLLPEGKIVSSSADITLKNRMEIIFANGKIICSVEEIIE
jgi:exodeoxyribonuclease VII large subunit